MRTMRSFAGLLASTMLLGCGGGIHVKGGNGSTSGGSSSETVDVEIPVSIIVSGPGSGLQLLAPGDSPTVMIFVQRLNFEVDCSAGGGSATEAFMALGSYSTDAFGTANATFTTTIPKYCINGATAAAGDFTVKSLVGKFGDANTGLTFTLLSDGSVTTYASANWSVHGSFTAAGGPPATSWTAKFDFDKARDSDETNTSVTARETVNGTVAVNVNDRCSGAAMVGFPGTSVTKFKVLVPHDLTSPVQWTQLISDNSGAVSPYTEDGTALTKDVNNADNDNDESTDTDGTGSVWTFDFASATTDDAAVVYKLTTSGADNMNCIATLTIAITAVDNTPSTIP